MRALVVHNYGGPESMKIEEIPVPKPGKNEVLIRIHAAGVNPVDTYIRAGYFHPDVYQTPLIIGSDAAGVVEEVGAGVTRFKKGERVFCWNKQTNAGCYAQYCVTADNLCWSLPGKCSFAQGAAIGIPYLTAYNALFQTGWSKKSKSVLIHGASGGVGLAACQLARHAGMTVYGTAGTEEGMKLVQEAGAHHVFNHRDEDYVKKLMEATKGEGVDLILENVAHANLGHDLDIIKKNGIIAVIGSHKPVSIDAGKIMAKRCAIFGIMLFDISKEELNEAGAAICRGLENGSLNPIIDKEYPLERAGDAHKDIMESSGAKGKLVLIVK